MSEATRPPALKFRYFDANGYPLAAGKVFTYAAGSTTPAFTYADYGLVALNTNPVILDSSGEATIYLPLGDGYKFIVTDSNTAVVTVEDNIYGGLTGANISEITELIGGSTGAVWIESANAPTYSSSTQFILPGDQRINYAIGNRVRFKLVVQTGYGTITNVSYTAPNTAITIARDSIGLDNTLASVAYSTLSVNSKAVDAAAVSYTPTLGYTTPGTVGYAIKSVSSRASILQSINLLPPITAGATETLSAIRRTITGPTLTTQGNKMLITFTGYIVLGVKTTNGEHTYQYDFVITPTVRIYKAVTGLVASPIVTIRTINAGGRAVQILDISATTIFDPSTVVDGLPFATNYSATLDVSINAYSGVLRPSDASSGYSGPGQPAPYFTATTIAGQFAIVEL